MCCVCMFDLISQIFSLFSFRKADVDKQRSNLRVSSARGKKGESLRNFICISGSGHSSAFDEPVRGVEQQTVRE